MPYPLTDWAMAQAVPSTAKHVLLVLAAYADKEGLCWPSVATIATKSGLGERAIQTALRLLIGEGLIVVTANEKGGRGCTPRYQLQVGKGAPNAPIDPERAQEMHPKRPLNGAHAAPFRPKRVQETTSKRVHLTTEKGAPRAPELTGSTKREGRTPPPPKGGGTVAAPEWVPPAAWAEWNDYRRGRKWTVLAANLSIAALERYRADGDEPAAVIHQSIAAGWTGLFPLKRARGSAPERPGRLDWWITEMANGPPKGTLQ